MKSVTTEIHGLSKSRILLHRQCPKRLWLKVYHPELEEPNNNTGILDTGTCIGKIAQQLHPAGALIDGTDLRQAISDTQEILAGESRPIFEATFQADGVLIRADLLLPEQSGYRMIEVKSSTSVKDYYLDDATIQSWVARQAKIPLSRVEIAYINNEFVYPGRNDYSGLFNYADISEQISGMEDRVPGWINSARETLSGKEPNISPGEQCISPFKCSFCKYCSPTTEAQDEFPVEILPNAKALAATLRLEGHSDLRHVPEERLDKPRHQRLWRVAKSGQPELNPEAGRIISALSYPRYYIDFETISLAVPIWAGTTPFMQVPFQWSCHIETARNEMTHREYLADGRSDPRRSFAESLIKAVGTDGPIFVYNAPFERSRMQEIADYFPDLARAINSAIDRLVDLLPIAREHYYHPGMRGSWSLKAVLPTIAPELSYDKMAVANGGMAQEAFAEIVKSETSLERRLLLSNALLEYCERDTIAMVRIAHYFEDGI